MKPLLTSSSLSPFSTNTNPLFPNALALDSNIYSNINQSEIENNPHLVVCQQQNSMTTMTKNSIKLCRRRKARTVFSDQQLSGLEKRFEVQKYLSTPERVELANSLSLSETQVHELN